MVGLAQEFDGFDVFPSAVLVGYPLSFGARVVAVDHGGDGVNAQSVHAVVFRPIEGVAGQVVAYFVAAVVEDVGVPVLVVAFARVGVFVEGGAVEAGEAVFVGGEVSDDPVEDDVDAGFVRFVDEVFQAFGVAEAAGRRVEAGGLVAPRTVEGKSCSNLQQQQLLTGKCPRLR